VGHDHSHVPGAAAGRAGARYRNRLAIVFGLTIVVLVVEVVGGILTNSLALLSDAAHMLTDAVGVGMALAAVHLASRPSRGQQRTFGLYRLEILAALSNTVLLFGVAVWVMVEAVGRFSAPEDVDAGPMLVVAVVGLVANVVGLALLRSGAEASLNVRGAYLEVLGDALGSIGVIVAALVATVWDWPYADPIVAVAIGLFILPRALRLGRDALRVLVQEAPDHLDVASIRSDLASVGEVTDVHDLHVWTLTAEMEVVSAHLMVPSGTDPHGVLDRARQVLAEQHGVHHATLQVEPEDHTGCDQIDW
jgi:cobalt-zinc-cadmium efflux system protein